MIVTPMHLRILLYTFNVIKRAINSVFSVTLVLKSHFMWMGINRGAESESEPESESESPGVVATSQESDSESTKLPRLRLRNFLFESVI